MNALFLSQQRKAKLTFLGMGIGLGLTFLPALSVAAHHFSRRRGLVMGIMTSGRPGLDLLLHPHP